MSHRIKLALAGNPNSGKTSVFNAITGARQRVGNYPGVTVEKKEGVCRRNGHALHLTDLPGIYSLTAYSIEEIVARNYLFDDSPDVVVCIVDASNLERNLYLVLQLKELGIPLVIALNMIDVARSRGYDVDVSRLSETLGVPIVPTVGHRGQGIDDLLRVAVDVANGENGYRDVPIHYSTQIEKQIDRLANQLERRVGGVKRRQRWLALKLIEHDERVRETYGDPELLESADRCIEELEARYGEHPEILIAEGRYRLISDVCKRTVRGPESERRTKSDRIDAVVTHRVMGLPLFLGLMYLVFQLTFALGAPMMDAIEAGFGRLGQGIGSMWPETSASVLRSLLVDGVIGGVGGVIVFLPNILLLFLAISLLESSGYMARAAFIMDRLMNKIGLHGKSFIPLLIGFGCSVPAIMATRTLDNRRDRLTTMLVIPLISCSARLPIYLLIIPAFFPGAWHAPMLWVVYIVGILLAVASAKLLRLTVFKGASSPFLMELPPYKVPTFKGAALQMWERGRLFLKKAGTTILGITIVLWALTTFPRVDLGTVAVGVPSGGSNVEAASSVNDSHDLARSPVSISSGSAGGAAVSRAVEMSFAGRIGHAMEPVIRQMGFDWRIGTALLGAFAAKEIFVAQMGVVHSVADADENAGTTTLRDRLRARYSPLVAFCIMMFTLISSPCMATIAVTRRESNSWRWAAAQFWGLTGVAYVLTVIVYQVGIRLGLGV